jgi:hypothetical protein
MSEDTPRPNPFYYLNKYRTTDLAYITQNEWLVPKPTNWQLAFEVNPEKFLEAHRYAPTLEPFKGVGLVATSFIKEGTWIGEYYGEIATHEYFTNNNYPPTYNFELDFGLYLSAHKKGSIMRFANHSCNPNTACDLYSWDGDFHLVFLASRNIQAGEYIHIDYGFGSYDKENFDGSEICRCGAPNCFDRAKFLEWAREAKRNYDVY